MPVHRLILVLKNIFQQALTAKRDQFMSFPVDGLYSSMHFGLPVYNNQQQTWFWKKEFKIKVSSSRDQFMSFPVDVYSSMHFGLPVYNNQTQQTWFWKKEFKSRSALQANLGKTRMACGSAWPNSLHTEWTAAEKRGLISCSVSYRLKKRKIKMKSE